MNSIEAVGKNVEQAIENGLAELNTTRDKVSIEIIETGGLFKKAKVILTLDEKEENGISREENIKRLEELEKSGALDSDFSSLLKKEETTAENAEKAVEIEVENTEKTAENVEQTTQNEESEQVAKESKEEQSEDEEFTAQEFSVGATKAQEFLSGMLKLLEVEAKLDTSETRDDIKIEIVGKDAHKIIGKRGDGLNAVQYLTSVVGARADRDCGRIYVDTCGYKEEREQELIKLARKLKYTAVREERVVKLEPMSALDRKTIHKALQEDDLVETYSEGEEPRRYLVIEPKKVVEE